MAEPLRLVVWTPSETLLEAERVEWVHVELAGDQRLTIWPGHLPMLGETTAGALSYRDRAGQHTVELEPGIVQVEHGTVNVFLSGELGESTADDQDAWGPLDRLAEDLIPIMDEVRGGSGSTGPAPSRHVERPE